MSSAKYQGYLKSIFRRPFSYALLTCFNYNENNQISLDNEIITDIERNQLHREIYRTQGKLARRYEVDTLVSHILHKTFSPDVGRAVRTYAVSPIETPSTKTEKAANKPTTSTATKSASRVR